MRYIRNISDSQNKYGDTNEVLRLSLINNKLPLNFTDLPVKVNISNNSGYVLSMTPKKEFNNTVINLNFNEEPLKRLTPDSYLLEVEVSMPDGTLAVFPTESGMPFTVNSNLKSTTGHLVPTVTFDTVLEAVDEKVATYLATVAKGDKGDKGDVGLVDTTADYNWTGTNTFNKKIITPAGVQGNADTATKLQTPRKINGTAFDGTSDITVDPVVREINTAVDLFTLVNGFYYNAGVVSTNKPTDSNYFVVEVIQNTSNGFMRVIDDRGLSFWTTKSAGYWSAWHQDANGSTVVNDFGRQNTLSDKFNSIVDDIGGETPDYYVDRINGSDFTGLSPNNFNVGFITDAHFQYGGDYGSSDKHFKYSGALAQVANLDAYIAGGDNINGDHNRKNKYNQAVNVTETLINRVPDTTDVFFLLGNHDTGIGQSAQTSGANLKVSDNLDEKTIKSLYRADKSYYGEVRDGDSLYGYKDYLNKKVRLIFINSFDLPFTSTNGVYDWNFLQNSGFQNAQLNWLANTALKVPDATWQVMIFSHAPMSGSFSTDKQENTDALLGILNAYKNGTSFSINDTTRKLPVTINVDYSSQGVGTLIAFVSGHVHQDGQMVYQGLNLIQTTCSWSNTIKNSARVVGTNNEDAQDVFSVNTSSRTISIRRFGYGYNRSYTY